MPRRFHVSSRIDAERHLIVFVMSGEIDTAAMTAAWIEAYSHIAEPWSYGRLFDYRHADGMVDYDQLARFAGWWGDLTRGVAYSGKVAIVVNNALDAARVKTARDLFPNDTRVPFTTLDGALEWLGAANAAEARAS